MLDVALPKGRLGERVWSLFQRAAVLRSDREGMGRKLVFEDAAQGLRCLWVKPSDVATYVERGAADVGVVGKDVLMEEGPDVYELLDLRTGLCRMAVAAPEAFRDSPGRALRVATTFPNVARAHYGARGREVDVIRLNGSVELAPLSGLSDVIVDIVETGTTLRENGLHVIETVADVSARLIANKASSKFKGARIGQIVRALEAQRDREARA